MLPASKRIPFRYLDEFSPAELRRWFVRHQAGSHSYCPGPQILGASSPAGIEPFRDVDLFLLDRSDDPEETSGVNQRFDLVGSVGVDLVIQDLMINSTGLPRNEKGGGRKECGSSLRNSPSFSPEKQTLARKKTSFLQIVQVSQRKPCQSRAKADRRVEKSRGDLLSKIPCEYSPMPFILASIESFAI